MRQSAKTIAQLLVFASAFVGCSESTTPNADVTPVTISLPANSGVAVLAASQDRVYSLGQGGTTTTRALDARQLDGVIVWTVSVPACSSPAAGCFLAVDGSGNLYVNTDDGLMSRGASSGSLRWTAATVRLESIAIGTGARLYGAGRAFIGSQSVYAIDMATGTTGWTTSLPNGFDATTTLLDETRSTVYAIGRGGAIALDTQTGSVKWALTRNCFGGSMGAVAADGTVYVTCDNDFSSRLYAYNPAGTEKWQLGLGNTNGTLAPVIDAAGVVYVGNSGSMTALNPTGTAVWQLEGLFSNWASPVIDSNKNVYVVAAQTNAGPRSLLVVNGGTIAENKGLSSCESALLLLSTGRAYCSAIDALMRFQTDGYDGAAQWNQFGHDFNRASRR